jgi:hypothetical protein
MRKVLTVVAMAAFWCSFTAIGVAQGEKAPDSPNDKKVEAKTTVDKHAAGWSGPRGGPGMGFGNGPAWLRQGKGPGRGGNGFGPGPGAGRGMGMGLGAGWGFRYGATQGGGGRFVDQDNNGICDHYELRHATQE